MIPHAVYRELNAEASPPEIREWIAVAPDWLEIRPPTTLPVRILSQLGEGESAAIQLAEELKADLLVMDERAGREEALKRGLPVIGTLGILERASERGLLDFAITFTELKARNFFVSPALAKDFLERDARRKKGTDY